MSPIKAIILDVDGVIIGEKIGFNFPYPHPDVTSKLKEIRNKGIPIFLCTAKPHSSIEKIIKDAHLNNIHVTQGGAVLINPVNNKVIKKHLIDKKLSKKVIQLFIDDNTYTEFYSLSDYFIQNSQQSEITKIHFDILQKEPVIVSSLADETQKQDIVKIMPIAKNEEDKRRLTDLFSPFNKNLTFSWGSHPIALPRLFGIITAPGISKKQAVSEISKHENVLPSEMLAVGDSTSDWQFIEQCGFAAAMGNATNELKKLVLSKGKDFSFIGKSVDENGILDIFNHFEL